MHKTVGGPAAGIPDIWIISSDGCWVNEVVKRRLQAPDESLLMEVVEKFHLLSPGHGVHGFSLQLPPLHFWP